MFQLDTFENDTFQNGLTIVIGAAFVSSIQAFTKAYVATVKAVTDAFCVSFIVEH